MKKFWGLYNEDCYGRFGFEAESEEHAAELMRQIRDGEISDIDLPNFWKVEKSYEIMLEDVKEVTE